MSEEQSNEPIAPPSNNAIERPPIRPAELLIKSREPSPQQEIRIAAEAPQSGNE